jgi:XapX domain-containing protein
MKILLGLILGLAIGAVCRWTDIPLPSPPKLIGAVLVLAMTVGYLVADFWLTRRGPPPADSAPAAQALDSGPSPSPPKGL